MSATVEYVDVVVVGAGISGLDAAHHLRHDFPGVSFAVLEGRSSYGGTWDLFKYPGIRSDSDMFTFGYDFHPWPSPKPIASGKDILAYLGTMIRDSGLHEFIRFNHKVASAAWSTQTGRWSVQCENGVSLQCRFLWGCSGYYDYDRGHEVDFPGAETFTGQIVHPQKWDPAKVQFAGKRVVVIGSGATAVTLVPSLAAEAKHVTMLQRSPTYIMAKQNLDPNAEELLNKYPAKEAHARIRDMVMRTNTEMVQNTTSSKIPKEKLRRGYIKFMRKLLPVEHMSDEEFKKHFTPRYFPWEQRLCVCPDNDFYESIKSGRASIATDLIERFDETGILLSSGDRLDADLIVTATGLQLQSNFPMAHMMITVDGVPYVAAEHVFYKDCMMSGVPNFAFITGYFTASFTLKADLIAGFVCRIINRLLREESKIAYCIPCGNDPSSSASKPQQEEGRSFVDGVEVSGEAGLFGEVADRGPGYIKRSAHLRPKYGINEPWIPRLDYFTDRDLYLRSTLDDECLLWASGERQLQQRARL